MPDKVQCSILRILPTGMNNEPLTVWGLQKKVFESINMDKTSLRKELFERLVDRLKVEGG